LVDLLHVVDFVFQLLDFVERVLVHRLCIHLLRWFAVSVD
jgi:hypothetical protein